MISLAILLWVIKVNLRTALKSFCCKLKAKCQWQKWWPPSCYPVSSISSPSRMDLAGKAAAPVPVTASSGATRARAKGPPSPLLNWWLVLRPKLSYEVATAWAGPSRGRPVSRSSVPQKQRGVINSDYHRARPHPPSAAAQPRPPAGDSIFWVHLIIFTACVRGWCAAGGCSSLCSALEHVNNHYTCLHNSVQPRGAAAASQRAPPPSRSYTDITKMLCC